MATSQPALLGAGRAPVRPGPMGAQRHGGLPRGVRLGTSSWSFPGWAGEVWDRAWPPEVLARDGLPAYAAHPLLGAVGVDRSYYAPLHAEQYAAWARDVPADFRFVVKAHQHTVLPDEDASRYLDAAWAWDSTVGPARDGLGARLGAVVFQLPPGPEPRFGGASGFAASLDRFLGALRARDARVPLGVEVRQRALLTRRYADVLRAHGVLHVINVFPGMPTVRTQARVAAAAAPGGARIVRWMLRPDRRYREAKEAFSPFDTLVAPHPEARADIAEVVRAAVAEGADATVIINNKAEGSAPLSVVALSDAVRRGTAEGAG